MEKFKDVGFAKLDMTRRERTGCGETIYCPGKSCEQLAGILEAFREENIPALGTRCSAEQFEFVKQNSFDVTYDPVSKILSSNWGKRETLSGLVAVCTGGTADIPVAEEACRTAEFFGCSTLRCYDVGVAGLHRLLGPRRRTGCRSRRRSWKARQAAPDSAALPLCFPCSAHVPKEWRW